jgi:hypothetical protein
MSSIGENIYTVIFINLKITYIADVIYLNFVFSYNFTEFLFENYILKFQIMMKIFDIIMKYNKKIDTSVK